MKILDVSLQPSKRKGKRYHAIIYTPEGPRHVHFGSSEYENYTMHQDPTRKKKYITITVA